MVVTVAGFTAVAQSAAKAAGVEDLRLAAYPGAYGVHQSELRENIEKVLFDQITDGLTKEVRGVSAGVTGSGWNPKEIVLRGTFEEVSQFFFSNEWTASYYSSYDRKG